MVRVCRCTRIQEVKLHNAKKMKRKSDMVLHCRLFCSQFLSCIRDALIYESVHAWSIKTKSACVCVIWLILADTAKVWKPKNTSVPHSPSSDTGMPDNWKISLFFFSSSCCSLTFSPDLTIILFASFFPLLCVSSICNKGLWVQG